MSLRGDRIISSIPKDVSSNEEKSQCPHLNANNNSKEASGNWVYPSPKMFWEAMKRKGTLPDRLKDPESPKTQEELDWIVTIHNVVNEQCWQEIRKWETFRKDGCTRQNSKVDTDSLKLQRFLGRPDDLSPRAWFKSTVLGYRKPFDRHDWYVRGENEDNSRRYVIDFYSAAGSKNDANALHLDVRPALDSIDSIRSINTLHYYGNTLMQPDHKCSQDCETLHKEIFKKIMIIILNSRNQSITTGNTSNNWFGLETPMISGAAEALQGNEEMVKSFLSGKEERKIEILIYLDNEEGAIGIEETDTNRKGPVRRGRILLELWQFKFHPKNIENGSEEGEIRKLYKRTSLFIRSLFTISRLLPAYTLLQQKLPFQIEIKGNNEDEKCADKLGESLIASESESGEEQKAFEVVNKTELSMLQTSHGDLEIGVQFKKLAGSKLYTIIRSPAIRVPQQVIKAKDVQVKSSPVGSGDWVDMTQQHMYSLNKQSHSRQPSLKQQQQPSSSLGQIKILTTAHKPVASSLADNNTIMPKIMEATEFIKLIEKVPEISANSPSMTITQMIQVLETGRSRKIHFDRWLEELEIEHESAGFDLINNME